MNTPNQNLQDAGVSALLRKSRPAPPLPPRFREDVWRRIQGEERRSEEAAMPSLSWLDALVQQLLRPRWAMASLVVVIFAGSIGGAVNNSAAVRNQAQARYLSAVAPSSVH